MTSLNEVEAQCTLTYMTFFISKSLIVWYVLAVGTGHQLRGHAQRDDGMANQIPHRSATVHQFRDPFFRFFEPGLHHPREAETQRE